jgi:hypothetical protein
MATFIFDSLQPRTVEVANEPWAQLVQLETKARIVIDYDEPADLDVTLNEDGSVCIGISTERLRVSAPGLDGSS